MKPGFAHIILILFLALAGCMREKSAPREHKTPPGQAQTAAGAIERFTGDATDSLFQDAPDRQETAQGYLPSAEDPAVVTEPYYEPAWEPKSEPVSIPGRLASGIPEETAPARLFDRPGRFSHDAFFRYGVTAGEFVVALNWDNDMIDYTDYYYTSGLALEVFHPGIAFSPLSAMLPRLRASRNHYSLVLMHNMYTPIYLDMEAIQENDRPFAAYLALGHRNISLSQQKMRRVESELLLGVIGPAAGGGFAQNFIHEDPSMGWQNQVHNDFIVNYSLRYEQGMRPCKNLSIALYAAGQAGTLYDNLKAGLNLQAGKTDRYGRLFLTSGPERPFRKRVTYYFALDLENKLVLYDATLQGGMINRDSPHTLGMDRINRYVFTGRFSTGIGFGRYAIEAEQFFLTPEYEGGRKHLWLRIRNIVYLN